MLDKVSRGRSTRGEKNPRATLRESQVLEIAASDMRSKDLATKYGVTKTAIYGIKSGRSWSYLTGINLEQKA